MPDPDSASVKRGGRARMPGRQPAKFAMHSFSNAHEFITSRGLANPVYIYRLITRASLVKIWAADL